MNEKKQTDYKKIYRSSVGSERSTLFAAEDHFLVATIKGYYNEEYYRFFFSDIVALKIRIDRWANTMLVVLIILDVLFAAGMLINEPAVQWISGGIFLVLFLAILYVIFYGPQAKLVFRTATTEKDFPMGRQKKILKLLKKLRPYIEKAQGEFDPTSLREELAENEKTYKV